MFMQCTMPGQQAEPGAGASGESRSRPGGGLAAAMMLAAFTALLSGGCLTMRSPEPGADEMPAIQQMWDYNDPAGTEQRLLQVLPTAIERADTHGEVTYYASLLTQIARTHSLRRQFREAHAVLDQVQPLLERADSEAHVRYLLERGRTLNSAGDRAAARALFDRAWQLATADELDGLAVDAAHMLAIVADDHAEALDWNQRALSLAESSADADANRWVASLHNNLGWTFHVAGEYAQALTHFNRALDARKKQAGSDRADVRAARWCVARCLRSMGRTSEALAMQQSIARDARLAGDEPDGYVQEEIAECLHALGRPDEARAHFARAHELLSRDSWLASSEPQRLERLRMLADDQ